MKRYFHQGLHLAKSATARNLYWVFSGNIITILMAVAATALIGKAGPAQLGLFLALFSFASLVADFSEIGLGSALSSFIPRLQVENKKSEINVILSTAFFSQLIIGLIVTGILLLIAPLLSQLLFDKTAISHILITGVLVIILLLFNFGTFALSSLKKFQENALMNIFAGLIRLTLLIIFSWYKMLNLTSILWIQVVSLGCGFLYSLLYLQVKFIFTKPKLDYTKKLLLFSSPLGIQKLFVAVSSRLDILMLTSLVGAASAGVYGAAMRFAQVYPYAISSFAQVLAPTFASFSDKKSALGFLKKTLIITSIFVSSMVALYILAEPLISIPFGKEQYQTAIPVFRALLIAMIGFILAVPFNSFLTYFLKKPFIIAFGTLVQLIIIFVSNIIFIPILKEFGPILGIGLGNLTIFVLALGASWYYFKEKV